MAWGAISPEAKMSFYLFCVCLFYKIIGFIYKCVVDFVRLNLEMPFIQKYIVALININIEERNDFVFSFSCILLLFRYSAWSDVSYIWELQYMFKS